VLLLQSDSKKPSIGTQFAYTLSLPTEDGTKTIADMAADGNCLFRALSDQIYWDYGDNHEEVRSEICDFLALHEEEFSVFLVLDENEDDEDAADFESYISTMRTSGEWGGNLELVAAARLYR
jgi:OTU domain-containing protein 3